MKSYVALGSRNRTLLDAYGLLDSYRHAIPGTKCQIEKALDVGAGYPSRLCHEVGDRARIRKLLEEEIRAGKYTQVFFDSIDTNYKDTVKDIKSFSSIDFTSVPHEELSLYFDRFYHIYITTFHPMVLAIYASDLQDIFEKELRETLKNDHPTQLDLIEATALLLTPTRLTTVQKEEQLMFEIEQVFESEYPQGTETAYRKFIAEPKIREQCDYLTAAFGWFHMEYIGEPKTRHKYEDQLWNRIEETHRAGMSIREQSSPLQRLTEIKLRQKEFFATHATSDFFKHLVFAMQEFLIVLDFSKADLVEGIYYARSLLTELGNRVGLPSWIDVRYLLPDELHAELAHHTTVDASSIAERRKNFTLKLENHTLTAQYGAAARVLAEELVQTEDIQNTREFKGQTAYPGLVHGVATIVTSARERDTFKQGEILVTIDTTTELTSVIKKSIAIVADQGGLLSHTAIVAREFKIPCLVQTRIGTQLVKNGDRLEVDATNGMVRILSHA